MTPLHPAYRRVIPHHRSFLNEQEFDNNLLVLTHEVTHVLSLLGGIGTTLACLRWAALGVELALWRLHVPADAGRAPDAEPLSRLALNALAPLTPGRTAALADVAHGLALHRLAQRLQDVWTPWLEGLAVFGETSADPLHDAAVVDPVNGALSNLVDVPLHEDPAAGGVEATAAEQLQMVIDEFQQRSAAALRRHGAGRLSHFLRDARAPYYWVGYLAVRAVVSRWRQTSGRQISGTQAFRVLLHATRFDTEDMVPPLDLDEPAFAIAAEAAMLQWVQRLAALRGDQIDMLIHAHESGSPTTQVRWTKGRPTLVQGGDEAAAALAARLRDNVRQALAGQRTATDPDLVAASGLSIEEFARHANQTILLGSFLPIGRAEALFHLGIDPDDGTGHLVVLLRTTEQHAQGGGSSMNLLGVGLTPDSARELATQMQRTGTSRMAVTRVVDLGGLASPALGPAGLHLLALHYGDWFEIKGATPTVDLLLGALPDGARGLRQMLRARLVPDSLAHVERELVGSPQLLATRAIEWLQESTTWDASAPDADVAAAAARVHAVAAGVLLYYHDATPRPWPLVRLAQVALGDPALGQRLASTDFESLTNEVAEHRFALVEALLRTAQGDKPSPAAPDATLVGALQALAAGGSTILMQFPHGWDMVAH